MSQTGFKLVIVLIFGSLFISMTLLADHSTGAASASQATQSPSPAEVESYSWDLPPGFPIPRVPENNPMTEEKVELGRHLFYDTRLSINGTFSCATCHQQARAFTDGLPVAIGATGELHPRNSMSLTNVAYSPGAHLGQSQSEELGAPSVDSSV